MPMLQCSGEASDTARVTSGGEARRQLAAPVMADANRRIDLAAPLVSVRRHGGGAAGEAATRTDGTRPGHPKSVRTRRATMVHATARDEEPARDAMAVVAVAAPVRERDQEARFSDALSVADSCLTVNCSSASGLSDAVAQPPRGVGVGGGVMMDRFLPAAHAVAVLSPQCSSRKASVAAAAARNGHGADALLPPPEPTPTIRTLCIVPREKTDDADAAVDDNGGGGEWDAHSTRGVSSRRCGLLLPTRCMKSTLLLLNPAPAMRRRGGGRRRDRGAPLLSKIGRSQSLGNPLVRSAHDTGIMVSSNKHLLHLHLLPRDESKRERFSLVRPVRRCSDPGRKCISTPSGDQAAAAGRVSARCCRRSWTRQCRRCASFTWNKETAPSTPRLPTSASSWC
ncbi:Os05g0514400 [Oryza sativa Japonica Group]|uniref:Os05g0514400 protein n=1 Tax=Oryza sativa subsp. japonica TaxID=39947 RepID=Q0DGS5_ORYSJ|nr:Os05g0514400 [Oryza sativa Japonica Group]|eukprot:NP_001056034.2 Os05g0514400 [Oryza sativa Japonica Group]